MQVVDTLKLKDRSRKLEQFSNLQSAIGEAFPLRSGRTITYRLYPLNKNDELPINKMFEAIQIILTGSL